MRRMRDIPIPYLLIPLFIGGIALTVFLWTEKTDDTLESLPSVPSQEQISKKTSPPPPAETTEASQPQQEPAHPSVESEQSAESQQSAGIPIQNHGPMTVAQPAAGPTAPERKPATESELVTPNLVTPDRELETHSPTPKNLKALATRATQTLTKITDEKKLACLPMEYRGESPDLIHVDAKDWDRMMNEFHKGKKELLSFLKKRGSGISKDVVSKMEALVKNLKIQRPPAQEEPDLSWRGIGVITADENGVPLIRVGEGFLVLLRKNQDRARFELMRLIAQAWAPCELRKAGVLESPWASFLKCSGYDENPTCQNGSISDEGWAISSTLASLVAAPNCEIPALQREPLKTCFRLFGSGPQSLWKEARR